MPRKLSKQYRYGGKLVHGDGYLLAVTRYIHLTAVAREFGVRLDELSQHARRGGPAKWVAVELACRLCGLTQRAAGERYGGITYAAVGKLRRRLAAELTEDSDLRRRVDSLEESLTPG